jgi:TRAP-type C4-dicarboxylate transport system permease small subunit
MNDEARQAGRGLGRSAAETMTDLANGHSRRWSGRLAMLVGIIAACDLIAMTLVTVVDVVGRYLFNSPLVGADELTVFALAICVFAGLPLVVVRRGLIRVEVLEQVLPNAIARGVNASTNLLSGGFLIFCSWQLVVKASSLASYGDATMFLHLKTAPLAYLMAAMSLVSGLLLLALAVSGDVRRDAPKDDGA